VSGAAQSASAASHEAIFTFMIESPSESSSPASRRQCAA
jgi:hypothetical protein